ncbi:acyltransferase family protein [Amycolatopsis magusensis]|uniref:acyltransferase family protein n=1 Tax=Amycolatopsis magusensis TaxID=882444 RepID=UPI0024A96CB1|nr:acyltransferase [Amycolatopsis magusensis]MDI5977279.1 acyltransferase [Amycolatopsis magusensis]
MKQRYQLDVYRALAALAVAVFHAYQSNRTAHWPLEGTVWHEILLATDLFVAMFFVLSGFLLGIPVARAALGLSEPRPARVFLVKRVARLVPLYSLVVLLVWTLTNPEFPGNWRDLLLHLSFTHVYSDDYIFWTNGPAWSLADEMHFYLLLAVLGPLSYRWCARFGGARAKLAVLLTGVGTLIAVSFGYKLLAKYVWAVPHDRWSVWFGPLAKLDLFAIGLLMAVASAAGFRLAARWQRAGFAVAGAGLVYLAHTAGLSDAVVHTVVGLGCALVITSTTLTTAPPPRFLSWRPLVTVGVASYSVYLWHEPVLRVLGASGLLPDRGTPIAFVVTAVCLLVVVIPLAMLSYQVIEKTGMKLAATIDGRGRARNYYPELDRLSNWEPAPR